MMIVDTYLFSFPFVDTIPTVNRYIIMFVAYKLDSRVFSYFEGKPGRKVDNDSVVTI